MKSDNRKKAGVLQPIPLPERAWQQITTDLVTDLPESDGKTAVAVFVDRLTKMVHFFPCTKEITDVGRGSPPDRCSHERRTGDTKANYNHHNRNIMII